jgi:ribosomal protein S18 acetylase RimI-like enzyme
MNAELDSLVRLRKADIKPAARVLTESFQQYPLLVQKYPDESQRDKAAYYFFLVIVGYGIRWGEVYAASPRMEGIAVWYRSEHFPMRFRKILRSVPFSASFGFFWSGVGRLQEAADFVEARHQLTAPTAHWFLDTVGVLPQYQGKDYGGKLIRAMLVRTDRERLPAYLDTMDEADVRRYEHFGFRVVDKSAVPKTNLTNWSMLRDPGEK